MKVYEILSEAVPATGNVIPFPQGGRSGPPSTTVTPATTSGQSGLRNQRTAQAAELRRQGGPKSFRKAGDIIKKHHEIWKTGNGEAAKAVEKSFYAKLGTSTVWFLKALGFVSAAGELWVDLGGLEELYNNKEITKEDYEAEREFAFGVFEAQILVPMIARALANSRIVLMIISGIKNIVLGAGAVAGVTTGGVVSAASIAAMIATEAGITALQMWVGSDQGKDYIASGIGKWLRYPGAVGESIWNWLMNGFKISTFYADAEKKQGKFQNQKALKAATTPQEKQAAQQAIAAADADADDEASRARGRKDLK